MAFASTAKRETWVFQQVGKDERDRPLLKRLPFNFVEYDGDPARLLEPVSEGVQCHALDDTVLTPVAGVTAGVVAGFEVIEGNPFQAFALGMNVGF